MIIGDEGCAQLCQFLKGNNISSYGFSQICNSLKQCPYIQEINAEWNCIGIDQRGIEALIQLLRINKSIKSVDLKNNKIGPLCAVAINELLKLNSQLKTFDLKWNELGNQGLEIILDGLTKNSRLQNLDIRCNKLNEDMLIKVESIIQRNLSLNQNLVENDVDEQLQNLDEIEVQKNEQEQNQQIQQLGSLKEIENIIENERRRAVQLRETYQRETEQERQLRIELENNIVRLKDECIQKEAHVIQLEQKHNSLLNENTMIYSDVMELKKKILQLQENSSYMIKELSDQLNNANQELSSIEQKHQFELNSIINEKEGYAQSLNQQWEQRYRVLDSQHKQLSLMRDQLEAKLNNLQEEILRIKMDHEEDQRNLQTRILSDTHKKYLTNLEQLEFKVKDTLETKDVAQRRSNQLLKEIDERDSKVHEDFMSMEQEIAELREQLNSLHHTLSKTNINIEKLKSEIILKDSELNFLQEKLDENKFIMNRMKDLHKEQLEHIVQEQNNERRLWNESLEQQHLKILELERSLKVRELEQNRIKMDYENLCNMVQSNIQKQIGFTLKEYDFRVINQHPINIHEQQQKALIQNQNQMQQQNINFQENITHRQPQMIPQQIIQRQMIQPNNIMQQNYDQNYNGIILPVYNNNNFS